MSKREQHQAIPSELLNKEFLSRFFKDLHSQVLEQMLQGEMDAHLGYEKHSTEVLYFIMLDKLRSNHFEHIGLPDRCYLSDEDKLTIIVSLTEEQKTLIKRDFIVSHLPEVYGVNLKSKLMLRFANLHFSDKVKQIAKPHNDIYEKRRTSIIQRLIALGATLESAKAKTEKSAKVKPNVMEEGEAPQTTEMPQEQPSEQAA